MRYHNIPHMELDVPHVKAREASPFTPANLSYNESRSTTQSPNGSFSGTLSHWFVSVWNP